jgi:hypothetical protein
LRPAQRHSRRHRPYGRPGLADTDQADRAERPSATARSNLADLPPFATAAQLHIFVAGTNTKRHWTFTDVIGMNLIAIRITKACPIARVTGRCSCLVGAWSNLGPNFIKAVCVRRRWWCGHLWLCSLRGNGRCWLQGFVVAGHDTFALLALSLILYFSHSEVHTVRSVTLVAVCSAWLFDPAEVTIAPRRKPAVPIAHQRWYQGRRSAGRRGAGGCCGGGGPQPGGCCPGGPQYGGCPCEVAAGPIRVVAASAVAVVAASPRAADWVAVAT